MCAKPTLSRGLQVRIGDHRCITGSHLVRPGDNLGWFLRRPPVRHTSGPNRANQDLVGKVPYGIAFRTEVRRNM